MPNVVPPGTSVNFPSPNGDVGLAQPPLGSMGNLGRTTYRTSCFASVDPEADASRRKLRATLHEGSQPFQPVNVREIGDSFTQSGRPIAAFTPRQIQFSVKFFL